MPAMRYKSSRLRNFNKIMMHPPWWMSVSHAMPAAMILHPLRNATDVHTRSHNMLPDMAWQLNSEMVTCELEVAGTWHGCKALLSSACDAVHFERLPH